MLGVIVIVISLALMFSLFFKKNEEEMIAVIYYQNEVYDKIDLSSVEETKEKTYDFDERIVLSGRY